MTDATPDTAPPAFTPPLTDRPIGGVDAAQSNAAMADKILTMPVQPLIDGRYAVRVLEVRGRRTGTWHRVPIAVVQVHGRRYVLSPRADRPWALNLAANPACALLSADGRQDAVAHRAEPEEAVAALRLYLSQLRWAQDQFPFSARATDDEIRARLTDVAVYRLEPAPWGDWSRP
ncbi:protein of unknown function [Quadrisphaera granulorum]|uniref:Uncharacterized protein DUF385 n=1 Tax=Quadrisphaera granulorum TaxID=317664 RepID=A0A316AB31_9ACTN|nr:nitroreductase/quinone reductase family protein [Quadrisphaera granulorum]PWJ54913.1 uncharacterized protein DUF385 [Quadrisphaera granulorum]SZE95859.1 protein of unknown function [Quadrisphaera granulorum]